MILGPSVHRCTKNGGTDKGKAPKRKSIHLHIASYFDHFLVEIISPVHHARIKATIRLHASPRNACAVSLVRCIAD